MHGPPRLELRHRLGRQDGLGAGVPAAAVAVQVGGPVCTGEDLRLVFSVQASDDHGRDDDDDHGKHSDDEIPTDALLLAEAMLLRRSAGRFLPGYIYLS